MKVFQSELLRILKKITMICNDMYRQYVINIQEFTKYMCVKKIYEIYIQNQEEKEKKISENFIATYKPIYLKREFFLKIKSNQINIKISVCK